MSTSKNYLGPDLVVHTTHKSGLFYPINKIYHGRTVVLKVFSRFGCPFTRLDAIRLSEQKKKLHELGAGLVGVGFDELGESEFRMEGFWKGEMYLDYERRIYDFFRLPRVSKFQIFRRAMHKQIRHLYSSLKQEYGANLYGDILQTGGIFVINCKGRILYACPQSDIAVFSDIPEILEVCQKEFIRRTFKPDPDFTEELKKAKNNSRVKSQAKLTDKVNLPPTASPVSDRFLFDGNIYPVGVRLARLKP